MHILHIQHIIVYILRCFNLISKNRRRRWSWRLGCYQSKDRRKGSSESGPLVPKRSQSGSNHDKWRFCRNSHQHLESSKGPTLYHTLFGWRWKSQPWFPCIEMGNDTNAGEMGKYAVLSTLPDKIARFLYEYHDKSYTYLGELSFKWAHRYHSGFDSMVQSVSTKISP